MPTHKQTAARSYRWYAPRLDVIRAALPQILHDDRQQADIAAYDALDRREKVPHA